MRAEGLEDEVAENRMHLEHAQGVGEDQLSLAIGRDGQNARLAAKLTGWRIDIKSLTEAAGDTLDKLQNNAELAAMLPAAVEAIPLMQEVLVLVDHVGCSLWIRRPR